MSKGFLPDRGSPEAAEIIAKYPQAPSEQIEAWVAKFEYSGRHTFTDAVYRTYGVRRSTSYRNEMAEVKRESTPREQLRITTGAGFKTAMVINDTQNPYQDEKCLALVESFMGEVQPDYLFELGDMSDFYQISKFDKDPSRVDGLQGDVNNTRAMFRRHRKILPDARIILTDGNHERRWQNFLWTKAPELSLLTCLDITELFGLKEYEIEHVPYECGVMVNDLFLLTHGTLASVNSSYTAKRMFDKHGGCGMCAHTHRGGVFYKRNRFGVWGWWENFCLCDLYPDYTQNPDWVQGFSLIHFKEKRFFVEQIPILGHAFIYGGKYYG